MSKIVFLVPIAILAMVFIPFALLIDDGFKTREENSINERLSAAKYYLEHKNQPSKALKVYEQVIDRYGPIPEAIEGKEKILREYAYLKFEK